MDNNPAEQLLQQYILARESGEHLDRGQMAQQLADPQDRQLFEELAKSIDDVDALLPVKARPAAIIGGRYRLLEEIGSGGFGKVWLASDERVRDRPVAVKIINGLTAIADARGALERELAALSKVDHRGLVQVLDVGEEDANPYLVLTYEQGPTLDALIRGLAKDGAAPPAEGNPKLQLSQGPLLELLDAASWWACVAKLIREICDALQCAHDAGVIHRDLKPSNVIVRNDGQVVLLDFGIAGLRDGQRHSMTSRLIGTFHYLAPEQHQQRRTGLDARTDVYQVGLLLYELLTLRPAFASTDPVHVASAKILRGDVVPPSTLVRAVPSELSAICMRALEVSPARRYPSAAAMKQDLDAFLIGQKPRGVPRTAASSWVTSARRLCVRRRRPLVAAALVASSVGLGLLWASTLGGEPLRWERNGDRFALRVQADEPGQLFAQVTVGSDLDPGGRRILPLQQEDPPVWSAAIERGESNLAMVLPPRMQIQESADPGTIQVVWRIPTPAQVPFYTLYFEGLVEWADQNGSFDGVPAEAQLKIAKATLAQARSTGSGADVTAADLVGSNWSKGQSQD